MTASLPPDVEWIDDRAGVERLAGRLDRAPWIALDTESNSMFAYRERICLVQINAGGSLHLLDPLGDEDPAAFLGPLTPALERDDQPLLLHGGEYDVACLKRDLGLCPGGVFDTQQAAVFLGWPKTGYSSLVEAVCGVKLGKAFAQHDWGKRPVDPRALRYAIDDVTYLPELADHMRREIERADLTEELDIANQAVMNAAPHDVAFQPADVYRVKGIRELAAEQLPRLLALVLWRDEVARELDMPAGRLINDRTLVQIVRQNPRDARALRRIRLPGRIKRRAGEVVDRLAEARARPPEMPKRASSPIPSRSQRRRIEALKAWRKKEAARREVPPHVVLPTTAIDALARSGADDLTAIPQLGAKRIRLYGDTLRDLLAD